MITRLLLVVIIAGFFHDLPAIALVLRSRAILHQSPRCSTNEYCWSVLKSSATEAIDVSHKDGIHIGSLEMMKRTKFNLIRKDWIRGHNLHLRALSHFSHLHGSSQVGKNFTVPLGCNDWPTETWGLKLGSFAMKLGRRRTHMRQRIIRTKPTEMALHLKPEAVRSLRRERFELIITALLRYQELNGDMLVKSAFIVPDCPDWPPEVRGLKLGYITSNIRRGSSQSDKREELAAIGFVYECQYRYGYELIRKALVRYKKLNGHIDVPARYSIPKDCSKWPVQLRGINLGTVVHDIRRGAYGDRKDDMLSLGFRYEVRKKFDYDCVRIAIYKFRELNHGSTRIPAVYNIPHGDPWYPEETWGMFLGSISNRIKCGLIYQDKREELFGL